MEPIASKRSFTRVELICVGFRVCIDAGLGFGVSGFRVLGHGFGFWDFRFKVQPNKKKIGLGVSCRIPM